jgi:hypothetical protein
MSSANTAPIAAWVEVLSMAVQEVLRVLSAAQGEAFAVAVRGRLQKSQVCGAFVAMHEEADEATTGELRRLLRPTDSLVGGCGD